MGKTRVHLLAKELEIETKDLIVQLDRLGIRGRKAQSALEDDEVARVRAALAAQEKPQVHVGEEKIVADRMVKTDDEGQRGTEAHETVVERRVRANVIRRRVNRVEVAPTEAGEVTETPLAEPPVFEPAASPAGVDEIPLEASPEAEPHSETPGPLETEREPEPQPESMEVRAAEPAPAAPGIAAETAQPVQPELPRGARILGRIDLKQTVRVEPAPTPVLRRPVGATPAQPSARVAETVLAPGAEGEQKPSTDDKPKTGRHKKRVVKKQDVLELREKELRGGRIPKKRRVLPGKEIRKTEITVPKASKRVIKISEVITVGDLSREMGVKAGEVIKKLMGMGMMATINQVLDADTATLIASEFDHQVENVAFDVDSMLEVEHQIE